MTSFYKKYQQAKDDEQQEDILRNAVNQMFDRQLQSEIHDEINRAQRSVVPKKSNLFRLALRTTAVAATLALLVIGYRQLWMQPNPTRLATNLVAQEIIMHPGVEKGAVSADQARLDAIKAINEQNYQIALDRYQRLENPNEQDLFYQGCAALKSGEYDLSIQCFNTIIANPNSSFEKEATWYLALAYILNQDLKEASTILENIQSGDWKHEESARLLKTMRK